MAYTPINWQTGDTITAEKMNKMDNGWDVQETQLFSESVTTADASGMNMGTLVYSDTIDADSIVVTFNGTDYTCSRIDLFNAHFYGGFSDQGPDFSVYPFALGSADDGTGDTANFIYTESVGTYTVAVSAGGIAVSDNFSDAVNKCVDTTMPMQCINGVTTETAMEAAQQGSRLLYFKYNGATYIIVAVGNGSVGFTPNNSSIVAAFIDGVFNIGEV